LKTLNFEESEDFHSQQLAMFELRGSLVGRRTMPKTNRAASLVRYAKVENLGWRRGSIVSSKNGRVKPDAMTFNGKEYPIPASSHFQLRCYQGNKAVYVTVGSDFDAAQSMLEKFIASRQHEAACTVLGIITPPPVNAPKTLADHLVEYLNKKKSLSLDLSATSIHLYTTTLTEFVRRCKRNYATEITEGDVINFIDWLKGEGYAEKVWVRTTAGKRIRVDGDRKGYSQKSLVMRYITVRGFLRYCGVQVDEIIDSATHKRLAVKVEGNTDPFTQYEIDRLFAACDDYYRVVFTFLLSTGMRFREASHLTWADVDLDKEAIHIPGTQTINRTFKRGNKTIEKAVNRRTKSRKGREVPIFPSLIPVLRAWRESHPDTIYLFGTSNDLPNGHWLEYGKKLWREAGLNCGVCDGCHSKRDDCDEFYLHKFRHTFAHRCLDAGIPIHKVSKWMGHHSIEVTAIYLSGGSTAADRDPFTERRAA
jgi:integrase